MQTHKSLPNIKPGLAIYTYWPTPIEMEVELRTSGNNIFDSSTDAVPAGNLQPAGFVLHEKLLLARNSCSAK